VTNEQALMAFFSLENKRDWESYEAFLHPDVDWVIYSHERGVAFHGAGEYMEKIKGAYEGEAAPFRLCAMYPAFGKDRIACVMENTQGERSVAIFDFSHGLIRREWEFIL